MRSLFVSIFLLFITFWSMFLTIKIQKSDFYSCESFNKINNLYINDMHKKIPIELKLKVMNIYNDTGLLKINKCTIPENFNSLGVLNITKKTNSIEYIFNKFWFDFIMSDTNKNKSKNNILFNKRNIFSHSFYFDKSFSTIIESFQQKIQNIHILDTSYYMNIKLFNNLKDTPFSLFTEEKEKEEQNNIFLNIDVFYNSLSANSVNKTKQNLYNFDFSKELKLNIKEDNLFQYKEDNNIKIRKIRSIVFNLNNEKDFNLINYFINENFNTDIKSTLDYLKNNSNLDFGFYSSDIKLDIVQNKENNSFIINFLYN